MKGSPCPTAKTARVRDLNVMPTSRTTSMTMNEDLFLSCRIGKGSYGEVWRGVVRGRGTARAIDVAAKVVPLDGNNIGAVQHEVELQREAGNHPSVVGLLGCFHHDEAAWLLFELCATSVCDALLRRGAPLEEPMIAAVCAGTLRGLHWLHASCRIVHRDIKCANLLLTVGGEVQIADFGIASRLSDTSNPGSSASQPATARAGTVIGSPLWMAPEMIADGLCDTPVDVWSLGICALEMAQMQPPHAEIASPLRAMYRLACRPYHPAPEPNRSPKPSVRAGTASQTGPRPRCATPPAGPTPSTPSSDRACARSCSP